MAGQQFNAMSASAPVLANANHIFILQDVAR